MQSEDISSLISQTSMLMEQFHRSCTTIEQQLQQLTRAVHGLTQQTPTVLKQSADSSLQSLPSQVINKVKEGLERPVMDYQQRMSAAVNEATRSTNGLSQQIQHMAQLQKLLMWKVAGVVSGCLALLLAGGIWLSMHYTRVIRDNQVQAGLLSTINAADVSQCGDGQLCANVDLKGKRYGDKQQYFLVKPR